MSDAELNTPTKPESFKTGGATQKQAAYFYDLVMETPGTGLEWLHDLNIKDDSTPNAEAQRKGGKAFLESLMQEKHEWALRNIAQGDKAFMSKAIDAVRNIEVFDFWVFQYPEKAAKLVDDINSEYDCIAVLDLDGPMQPGKLTFFPFPRKVVEASTTL